jgi:hypothetical protein
MPSIKPQYPDYLGNPIEETHLYPQQLGNETQVNDQMQLLSDLSNNLGFPTRIAVMYYPRQEEGGIITQRIARWCSWWSC